MIEMDNEGGFLDIDHTQEYDKPERQERTSFDNYKPKNYQPDSNNNKPSREFKVPEGTYKIYTDGGCRRNKFGYAVGAWAFLDIQANYSDTRAEDNTTNNQMEMKAVINALKYCMDRDIVDNLEFRLDSEYVKNGILFWMHDWKKNDWKKVDRTTGEMVPPANLDLWKEMYDLVETIRGPERKNKIYWVHVKGHSGEEYNTKVDILCGESIDQYIKNME